MCLVDRDEDSGQVDLRHSGDYGLVDPGIRGMSVETRLADARSCAERLPKRPRGFFEDWDDPLISGIGWVSELIAIAGGIDIFADRAGRGAARDRVVTIDEVVAQEPDLIIGSWCGKKFRSERVMARPGFDRTSAGPHQDAYEIRSSLILQPGPAALTDGLAELQRMVERLAVRAGETSSIGARLR
jgi:iron complex transport system substrate-binding protein